MSAGRARTSRWNFFSSTWVYYCAFAISHLQALNDSRPACLDEDGDGVVNVTLFFIISGRRLRSQFGTQAAASDHADELFGGKLRIIHFERTALVLLHKIIRQEFSDDGRAGLVIHSPEFRKARYFRHQDPVHGEFLLREHHVHEMP